jgi:hypothetical protein
MRIWLASFLLLLVMGTPTGVLAQTTRDGKLASTSVTISTALTVVKVGSEVKISIVLTNLFDQEMFVTWDNGNRGELDYMISVLDRDGHEPLETKYFRAARGKDSADPGETTALVIAPSSGSRQVKAGGTLTDSIYLNKLYDLKPGKYTVQVERIDDSHRTVKSNMLAVTLTPWQGETDRNAGCPILAVFSKGGGFGFRARIIEIERLNFQGKKSRKEPHTCRKTAEKPISEPAS